MRIQIFPNEAWAITGGDDFPCLQLREGGAQRSTLDVCFDESNRHLIPTLRSELDVIERALNSRGPR